MLNNNFSQMNSTEIKEYVSKILSDNSNNYDYKLLISLLLEDERKSVKKISDRVRLFVENREKEINRVTNMYKFDYEFSQSSYLAGVDEVGRGPLAGPIVAAAVILDLNIDSTQNLILKINDSKKLSEKTRNELDLIIKDKAISYRIEEISSEEIDEKGIAWCNNEVLKRAVVGLDIKPELVLSDGYAIKNCPFENKFVIKGDSKSASIACASIIAKVYRDNLMKEYNKLYPEFKFEKNVGYGTKEHIEAIEKYGYSPIHRKSFLKNIMNFMND